MLQGGIGTLQVRSWWSGKTSDASTVKSDPHKVLLLGTPVCPSRRSHKLVMNWGKAKRSHDMPAPPVPMQQHKLNQYCQKNWPVLGSQVIYKNWRNRKPPSHLKKNTNHMKNLSIFPLEKSRERLPNLPLRKFMTTHQRNAREENLSCSIFCFVSGHRKSNNFYTRLKG